MLTFSYTITPSVTKEIEKINAIRDKILVELLPRKDELRLRWENKIDRATQASRLTSHKLKRQEVIDAVRRGESNNTDAIGYIRAYEWINYSWFLNKSPVNGPAVNKVFSYFKEKKRYDDKKLEEALEFVQVNPEHPIVQAGLALFLTYDALNEQDIKLSIIVSDIYMYKFGYDLRGMSNIEAFFASDLEHFRQLLDDGREKKNLSSYLEYFAASVAISAENTLRKIKSKELKYDLPSSFYELTERQKEIMGLFATPGVKVSNKIVQKQFKVSQITASRDLAKLSSLGLTFSRGKGRSVYYTRA